MMEKEDITMEDNEDSETERSDKLADNTSVVTAESDFYGDAQTKEVYRQKVQEIGIDSCSRVHDWNVQVIAARAVKYNQKKWPEEGAHAGQKRKREDDSDEKQVKVKKEGENNQDRTELVIRKQPLASSSEVTRLFNPYEGNHAALQIDESVSSFIARLAPSTSEIETPWIWAANFRSPERPTKPDIATFRQRGTQLLDAILEKRAELEAKFDPSKSKAAITRMMSSDRAALEDDILALAQKCQLTSGKWMLFPSRDKVDKYWEAVVYGTIEGRLGTAAKVATRPERLEEPTQVICVYTRDINDEVDIRRVLLELDRLGLVPKMTGFGGRKGVARGPIWYKPDCYTYLDITSGNEYKIRPTLYDSTDLLRRGDFRAKGS